MGEVLEQVRIVVVAVVVVVVSVVVERDSTPAPARLLTVNTDVPLLINEHSELCQLEKLVAEAKSYDLTETCVKKQN